MFVALKASNQDQGNKNFKPNCLLNEGLTLSSNISPKRWRIILESPSMRKAECPSPRKRWRLKKKKRNSAK